MSRANMSDHASPMRWWQHRRMCWGGGALVTLVVLVRLLWQPLGVVFMRDATWERIQREGIVRIGMDASYPPFDLVDEAGRFSGYDVDLGTAIAARWGVTPIFVNIHYDGLYDALHTGRIDLIISALPYDRTMTRDLRYSPPYFNAGQVLVVRAADAALTADDLGGRRVAVELGAEAHQLARQIARDEALPLDILAEREPEQVVARVLAGEADAMICDRVAAAAFARAHPDLYIVSPPLTTLPYVIASRIEDPEVAVQVDATLTALGESGLFAALESRWF